MSNSVNADQEQRKNTSMEDPKAMTIEFLRARLLSERSVSKSARQRSDELAKRVAELEEQLKFVSLQRKKAEMATADVLAILEDHGISDVSEEFDSSSDQEETLDESNSHNDMTTGKDGSSNAKVRRGDVEAYSSSELESSPSTGRSLSWKSEKDLQCSLEKKKYMDLARRRARFVSTGSSSSKRVGKSCRRIRHRETRAAMEELKNDGNVEATHCSDIGPDVVSEGREHNKEKNPPVVSENHSQETNGRHFSGHGGDDDMEIALQQQAQLIGQYEEEEKAQREWEEKYRENIGCTLDSCDPGSHSDVTEEQDEIKVPEQTYTSGATSSDNQDVKSEPVEASFDEETKTSKSLPSISDADKCNLQDQSCSKASSESSAPEFSRPVSSGKSVQQFLQKHHDSLLHSSHQSLPSWCTSTYPSAKISSSQAGNSMPMHVSSRDLAIMPQETSTNLGSVLEKLQQAKLSLKQNLSSLLLVPGGPSSNAIKSSNSETNTVDMFKIPAGFPGLFRLPSDNRFEATIRSNHPDIGARLGFTKNSSERAGDAFFSSPYVESRRAFASDQFLNVPPSPFTEIMSGVPVHEPQFQPTLSGSPSFPDGLNYRNPHTNRVLPSSDKGFYPFLPDFSLRLPSNEGTSRSIPSSEVGVPPMTRFSSFNDHIRPNMYR